MSVPLQKGKKRRKPRHRTAQWDEESVGETRAPTPVTTRSARPVKPQRRGLNLPWWANGLVGLVIIAAGVFFFINPARGTSHNLQLIFLLGYFVIGGLYVGKAYRQYSSRPRT